LAHRVSTILVPIQDGVSYHSAITHLVDAAGPQELVGSVLLPRTKDTFGPAIWAIFLSQKSKPHNPS
jgi:hypothetical protein